MHYKALRHKPFHRQDDLTYCGPACAQMILDSLEGGVLYDQDYLAQLIFTNNTGDPKVPWNTGPDALRWVLERHEPVGLPDNTFQLIESDNEAALSRRIVWAIKEYNLPPAALVFQMRHWLTVYGYQITGNPERPEDTGYRIDGFFVRSPSPYVTYPDQEHYENDDCGERQGLGVKFQHVTYETWQNIYMTGVPADSGSRWAGRYLAVSFSDRPNSTQVINGAAAGSRSSDVAVSRQHGPHPKVPVDCKNAESMGFVSCDAAKQGALDGLKKYGLYDTYPWSEILAVEHLGPGEPILVNIPGDPPGRKSKLPPHMYDPYYIVPMVTNANLSDADERGRLMRRPMLVNVDARSGRYQESATLSNHLANILSTGDWNELRKRVLAGDDHEKVPNRTVLRNLLETVIPEDMQNVFEYQWVPCPECFSRFLPVIIVGDPNEGHYHIRADGHVLSGMHSQLAQDLWGM